MTTEIAILNKNALVLAADSAVTVGRQRVWKTANKLFSLSPHNDIAIMAYGAGDLAGFPWETIVKTFRSQVGDKRYKTVQECAAEFIEYLKKPRFSADTEEQVSIAVGFIRHLELLKAQVPGYRTKKEFRQNLSAAVETAIEKIKTNLDEISIQASLKDFRGEYLNTIEALAKDEFKEHIPQTLLGRLLELLISWIYTKISFKLLFRTGYWRLWNGRILSRTCVVRSGWQAQTLAEGLARKR